ncbi:MAG: glycine betaine ABC transporter substrate-binding protein [Longimicrobiaceae bacterium]
MKRPLRRPTLVACCLAVALTGVAPGRPLAQGNTADSESRPVVVASKPFAESYLLAEMFAQLLEAEGIPVDRRLGLGATEIVFGALRNGNVDVYPEYTGTGLVAVLGEPPQSDPASVFRRVAEQSRARWGVRWLPPLGFQNRYAIAVRRETAERSGLATLSDLERAAPRLVAGFSPDFLGRDDGLPGLRKAYGPFGFEDTRALLQAVKYRALAGGAVDVIDGYSTDGALARFDLVTLRDDRGFFPAYEAAPVVSARLWRERPRAIAALTSLAGMLDEATMRRLNARVETDGEDIAVVARDELARLGLVASGRTDAVTQAEADRGNGGLLAYLWARRAELLRLTGRHLLLVGFSLLAAILVAVPLGLALERVRPRLAEGAIRGVGVLQTIPSIALLAFTIPLLGIGVIPALVALFLYGLYPIVRNTYTGVREVEPSAVEAATALGMTPLQVLRWVRLPLAAPTLMAGIRTAAVIAVGTATLAAFIGAGGLGDPIVAGLALSDNRMILSGAIPAALLALLVDALLAVAQRLLSPTR